MNKVMLYIEGFSILVLSLYWYGYHQFSWVLFFVFLLAPDLSALGYLINNRVGAIIYNVFHTYSIPIGVIVLGEALSNSVVLATGLIWLAHIGMDRMVGYGLKYPTAFKDKHLNQI